MKVKVKLPLIWNCAKANLNVSTKFNCTPIINYCDILLRNKNVKFMMALCWVVMIHPLKTLIFFILILPLVVQMVAWTACHTNIVIRGATVVVWLKEKTHDSPFTWKDIDFCNVLNPPQQCTLFMTADLSFYLSYTAGGAFPTLLVKLQLLETKPNV